MLTGVVKKESVPFSYIDHWPQVFSKYLSKRLEQSLDVIKRVLAVYLCALDQFLATPLANVNVVEGGLSRSSFFDLINNSRYAKLLHGALIGVGLLALLIGHVVSVYRKLRKQEKKSHFFYFRRLLQSEQNSEIKKAMGEDGTSFDILSAAAHFYSPGISRLVCWKRRFFCRGKRRKEYVNLKDYLAKKGLQDKRTEKEILNDIFIETIDKLVNYLNENTSDANLSEKFQRKNGTHIIGFSKAYSKTFFPEKIVLPERAKKNVSLGQSILEAIEDASFIYWICMFTFYFAPTVGVVAGLSFPPLALALFFLTIRCVYVTYAFKKDSVNEQIRSLNNKEADDLEVEIFKRKCEIDDVELKKQMLFLKTKEFIGLEGFNGSKLHKDLQQVLNTQRFMKAAAIVDGFVRGCFFPFFGIWLFSDLFKVVAGLAIGGTVMGPGAPAVFAVIFMVIAGVTLLLGVGYGVKKAIQAGKEQDERYANLVKEINKLERDPPQSEIKVLPLSLRGYDRVLRRYSIEQPAWTEVKIFLNRLWIGFNRLGTGSLVFRLVIWGSITSFITVPTALIMPISLPFIAAFALVFSAWYIYAYHIESKWKRAENITNYFYSGRMRGVKENILDRDPLDDNLDNNKEEPRTEPPATPKLLSTSRSEMNLHILNVEHSDLKKTDTNCSGGTSPDSIKSKISFNNSNDSLPSSSGYALRRVKSEATLVCGECPAQDKAQSVNARLSSRH